MSSKSKMSDPKRLKTDRQIHSQATDRQSFDRFEERLIKTIVHYLPLRSKINLICLNRRLKRCLSESQADLVIDMKLGTDYNSIHDLSISDADLDVDEEIDSSEEELNYLLNVNKQVLKHLLKTFGSIESINLSNISLNFETVSIICDNFCPNLKEFEFTDFKMSKQSMTKLGQTYGQSLTKLVIQSSFEGNGSDLDKVLLTYCQNLRSINCEDIETFTKSDPTFLPKVDTVSTFIKKKEDFECLKTIVEKYEKQLKALTLFIQSDETIGSDEELVLISSLTRLQSLHLDFFDPRKNLLKLDQSLREIAIKCKTISSFRIDLSYCSKALISSNLLNTFGLFTNLKKLWAQLLIIETIEDNETKTKTKSKANTKLTKDPPKVDITCLKGCHNLMHLNLCLSEIRDEFFANIDSTVPYLVSLKISSGEELSDATLKHLSRLKSLKSLIISKSHFKKEAFPSITDSGVESLFSDNTGIRSLVFLGQPNITQKSVDILYALAKRNPTKSYCFECRYRNFGGSDEDLVSKRVNIDSLDIPSNLFINFNSIEITDEELFDENDENDEELSGEDEEYGDYNDSSEELEAEF